MTFYPGLAAGQLFTPQPQGQAATQLAADQAPRPAPTYQAPPLGSIDPTTGLPWGQKPAAAAAPAATAPSATAQALYAATNGSRYGTYTNGQSPYAQSTVQGG